MAMVRWRATANQLLLGIKGTGEVKSLSDGDRCVQDCEIHLVIRKARLGRSIYRGDESMTSKTMKATDEAVLNSGGTVLPQTVRYVAVS